MANLTTTKPSGNDAAKSGQATSPAPWHPFANLRSEIDRLFDGFVPQFFDWPHSPSLSKPSFEMAPKVDVSETDKEYAISAELPGLEEKDVEITLSDGTLIIQGEKSEQRERKENGEQVHWTERSYGSFRRSFRVPESVDEAKVSAEFKNGVLKINLPKLAEAQKPVRKIEIKS